MDPLASLLYPPPQYTHTFRLERTLHEGLSLGIKQATQKSNDPENRLNHLSIDKYLCFCLFKGMFKRIRHPAKRFSAQLTTIGLFWLLLGLAGCESSTEHNPQHLIGQPARPYRLTLTLDPFQPRVEQEVSLTFRITDGDLERPLVPLQVLHERALHTFIVSRDLNVFAHTHHEDFFPLTPQDLAAATFHFPHTFLQPGEYMVVSEFTYKDRSWLKQFRFPVAGSEQSTSLPHQAQANLAREKDFGPYRVILRTSPDPPVAGHEVELVCEFSRDGSPVTDMGLYLGTEVHMASWRLDGEHFGHQHTYTPEMAAMMGMMRDHEQTATMKAQMDAMMIQLMSGPAKQVYQGPQIPVHHVFPTPGLYKLFFETAPGGKRLVTDFVVQVVEYDEGVDTTIQSVVPLSIGRS